MADTKEVKSISFTPFTIARVAELAEKDNRSFSLMCELLILEAIEAREQKALTPIQY